MDTFLKNAAPRPFRPSEDHAVSLVKTKPFVTVPIIAAVLGVSRELAYEGVKDGTIPSVRVGSRIRVPTARYRELLSAA